MAKQMAARRPEPNRTSAIGRGMGASLDSLLLARCRTPVPDTATANSVRWRAGVDASPSLPDTMRTCNKWEQAWGGTDGFAKGAHSTRARKTRHATHYRHMYAPPPTDNIPRTPTESRRVHHDFKRRHDNQVHKLHAKRTPHVASMGTLTVSSAMCTPNSTLPSLRRLRRHDRPELLCRVRRDQERERQSITRHALLAQG